MKYLAIAACAAALSTGTAAAQQGQMMQGGMMGQGPTASLRELPPEQTVEAVRYCEGQYFVSTAAGDVLAFPEFNLRLKTDMSGNGPVAGKPALIPAGMMGDRAFLVFAQPAEISGYIKNDCGAQ